MWILCLGWSLDGGGTAEAFLEQWTTQAKDCASRPFRRLAMGTGALGRSQYRRRNQAAVALRSAASTVWAISVAIVIGPTPPGTGV